jgi:alginate O-acetyltransferase complex protein AlgI
MLFQDLPFFIFGALTLVLYWAWPQARLAVLALANALFYAAAGLENLGLFLLASGATYGLGRLVTGRYGRPALVLGILANVANLCFFKYAGFLAHALADLLPGSFVGSAPLWVREVLLPIGISFYTFQHISYLVDRRSRGLPSAPSYLHFWVYISFFGHSIAGPIMRGHEFLPQIAETTRKAFDGAQFRFGCYLFGLGLVKKVGLADPLANLADPYFARAFSLDFGEAWAAALLFAFQIYYDFSAYSDMAVGIGHMFGYVLTLNFRTPYVAAGASEFWARWHVTLSAWIRDYVYIPLGGNRCGPARTQLNLALAMLASGLWHGAAWTFVFWGAWHAALLLGQRLWGRAIAMIAGGPPTGPAYRVATTAGFFLLVTAGWVLFRAPGLEEAFTMLGAMADLRDAASVAPVAGTLALCAGLYGLHLLEAWMRAREDRLLGAWVERVPAALQGLAYATIALWLAVSYDGVQDFIYFRF